MFKSYSTVFIYFFPVLTLTVLQETSYFVFMYEKKTTTTTKKQQKRYVSMLQSQTGAALSQFGQIVHKMAEV